MTDILATWPENPADAALILDFDGTLAPIVEDPTQARMPSDTAESLRRIAPAFGVVAVISGRPVSYLQRWARIPGARLVGLYGLEEVVDDDVWVHPDLRAYEEALDAARGELDKVARDWEGVYLEDKGWGLALHWRRAVKPEPAEADIRERGEDVAERLGLRADDGKMVLELRPPVKADKGLAVQKVADGMTQVLFAGDDVGDLPAFAAVQGLGGLAVAVDHGSETAGALLEAADVVMQGTEAFAEWLDALADRVT